MNETREESKYRFRTEINTYFKDVRREFFGEKHCKLNGIFANFGNMFVWRGWKLARHTNLTL